MALNTSSLNFNGTTNYAKLSTATSIRNLENFTFMSWVKVGKNSINQTQRAYVERQGTGTGVRFALTPIKGKLRFELGVRDGSIDTNYDFSYTWDDYWHHVAFVARVSGENPTYTMYLDGASVATGTVIRTAQTTDSATHPISNTAPKGSIYLGAHSLLASGESFATNTFWQGKLDDIMIFDESKTGTDIIAYMTAHDHWDGLYEDEENEDESLVTNWRFNQNTGTSVTNHITPAQTGSLQSSNMWTIDRPFLGDGLEDETPPSVPTGITTSAITADGFTASWNVSTDNVYVQFYELQLSTFSNFNTYISYDSSLVTTKKITGLIPNANYYWRVRAFDAQLNTSAYSTTGSLTTLSSGDVTPPAPPSSILADSISFSSFGLSWAPSPSGDVTGYKVDISTDENFSSFLTEYRNRDVGNVLSIVVFGGSPITTYFVRIRSYDAARNESANSTTYRLQTAALPDLTPPLPVTTKEATSVDSRAFTANWEDGIDDTRVLGYMLDVAYDSAFTQIVQTETNYYNAADVGNVTSYRVTGLNASTIYYYRVRAYDTANNVSAYPTTYTTVTTQPPSVEEGGFIYSTHEPLLNFDVIQSTPTVTDDGTSGELRVATGKEAFIHFDLSEVAGTIQNAMLRLYTVTGSATPVSIYVDDVVTTVQPWNTKPTVTSTVINATAATGTWLDVDVTSLLLNNAVPYTVRVTSTSATDIVFASAQAVSLNRPQLVIESDPQTATQVERILVTDTPHLRRNYLRNPSFESGDLTGWTSSNLTVNILTDAANAISGSRYVSATLTDVTGLLQSTYTDSPSGAGVWWTAAINARILSASETATLTVRFIEFSSTGTILQTNDTTSPLSAVWTNHSGSYQTINPSTAFVAAAFLITGVVGNQVNFDAAILEKSTDVAAYFDGNTSGGIWVGTVNNSHSTYPSSALIASSFYIGDADEDNSVELAWRRPQDADWIYIGSNGKNHNRATKAVTTIVPASLGAYNLVTNPSFELNLNGWSVDAGTMLRTESVDANSDYVLQATPTSSASITSVFTTVGHVSQDPLRVQAKVKAPVGSTVTVYFSLKTNDGVSTAGPTTTHFGTGSYESVTGYVTTVPADTRQVTAIIYCSNHTGLPFYVDQVQINRGSRLRPYRDGDHDDGIWYGTPHQSMTGVSIQPNTAYSFAHIYTDEEGFFDTSADTTLLVGHEYVTKEAPDDAITMYPIQTTTTDTSINIVIPYVGDDNENAVVELQYRRSDLPTKYNIAARMDRHAKQITGSINDLPPGTSFTISALITDPDGIFNTVEGVIETTTSTITTSDAPDGVSRITYGGFVLQGNNDDSISVGSHDAFGFAERYVQVEEYARVHGSIELANLWRKRRIRMEGTVAGSSSSDLADKLEALKQALAKPRQRLVVDTLANRGRYYTATCTDFQAPQQGGRHYTHLDWEAEFICADPFAYDAAESIQPMITVPDDGNLTVANIGHLESLPTLTVGTTSTMPVTISIVNETTGERIIPKATIVRGDTITIDSALFSVRKNGIEIDYTGSFPTLVAGGNTLHFDLFGNGTPTITFEMRWRNRYI